MKNLCYLFLIIPALFINSCAGNTDNEDENIDVNSNPVGAIVKMSEVLEKEAKKEKNKGKKNVKALSYQDLIKYLPTNIDGYKIAEEPTGSSVEMTGMSYSSAEVKFNSDNGGVHITLLDYSTAMSMYTMATAMWSMGLRVDTPEELSQSVKIDENINGWETFKKKSKDASVVLGVGDRFLLTVEATNQENCDKVKSVAKSLDLKTLANL